MDHQATMIHNVPIKTTEGTIMADLTNRIEELKTTIKLMAGDLRYCNTSAQVASIRQLINQRKEELQKLEEQVASN